MSGESLSEIITYLFNHPWDGFTGNDEEEEKEDEKFQCAFDSAIEKFGWSEVYKAIDNYMRTQCLDGDSVVNFAHLFWGYTCYNRYLVPEPYRFLGYLLYRMDLKPWEYDCIELLDGLTDNAFSGEEGYDHSPAMNPYYYLEKDPDILAEVERLRAEESSGEKAD